MAVDRLGVSAAELDQLDRLVFRDARTHKPCDAVDTFLHTWARPAGSELPPVLSEGALKPNPLVLDGESPACDTPVICAGGWPPSPNASPLGRMAHTRPAPL